MSLVSPSSSLFYEARLDGDSAATEQPTNEPTITSPGDGRALDEKGRLSHRFAKLLLMNVGMFAGYEVVFRVDVAACPRISATAKHVNNVDGLAQTRPKADGTAMRQQMGFLPKIRSPTFLSQGKIDQPAPELEEMYCSLLKVVLTLYLVKRELGSRLELRERPRFGATEVERVRIRESQD
ncbi:uncharacterized protein CCOS01_03665 [Colletotrichum costaricense]|uniref:Uncharacterized protein n=1 Tax=Colletotrichum costaricense TaxID=1209916 RepID=A0AAI9Z5Q5_9PEZI|nr:uncharacterized protein CCOS01_03665 [Colletotrichum costaricense]KAK1534913.1 hypothetical protein CCOS01_03665 [Colletotrichum costaricense]